MATRPEGMPMFTPRSFVWVNGQPYELDYVEVDDFLNITHYHVKEETEWDR